MRNVLLAFVAVSACLTPFVFGDVGDLHPVASGADQRMLLYEPLRAIDNNEAFTKPQEGDGTVNPKARIATLKTQSGDITIKAAVDSRAPDAKVPDVIRLDFSGKGKFDDTLVAPLARRGGAMAIGPRTVMVPVGKETIPVQVQGTYYHQRQWRYLEIRLSTALEGQCAFGEKVHTVQLVDNTNNFSCLDPFVMKKIHGRDMPQGDMVFVGDAAQKSSNFQPWNIGSFFGQPVKVDGKWYELTVSEDRKISAAPVEVEMTKAQIPHEKWQAVLLGKRFTLQISGNQSPFEIPVDSYSVFHYMQMPVGDNPQDQRPQLMCSMSDQSNKNPLVVKPGELNVLKIGPPLTAKLEPNVSSGQVNLSLSLADAGGANVAWLTNAKGDRPAPPTFEIFDETGKKVYSAKMEFG